MIIIIVIIIQILIIHLQLNENHNDNNNNADTKVACRPMHTTLDSKPFAISVRTGSQAS